MKYLVVFLGLILCLVSANSVYAVSSDPLINEMLDETHQAKVTKAGELAGEMMACGFEWEKYYLGFMQLERAQGKAEGWSDKKIAAIGAFFGFNQELAYQKFKDQKCSDEKMEELLTRMKQILKEETPAK